MNEGLAEVLAKEVLEALKFLSKRAPEPVPVFVNYRDGKYRVSVVSPARRWGVIYVNDAMSFDDQTADMDERSKLEFLKEEIKMATEDWKNRLEERKNAFLEWLMEESESWTPSLELVEDVDRNYERWEKLLIEKGYLPPLSECGRWGYYRTSLHLRDLHEDEVRELEDLLKEKEGEILEKLEGSGKEEKPKEERLKERRRAFLEWVKENFVETPDEAIRDVERNYEKWEEKLRNEGYLPSNSSHERWGYEEMKKWLNYLTPDMRDDVGTLLFLRGRDLLLQSESTKQKPRRGGKLPSP